MSTINHFPRSQIPNYPLPITTPRSALERHNETVVNQNELLLATVTSLRQRLANRDAEIERQRAEVEYWRTNSYQYYATAFDEKHQQLLTAHQRLRGRYEDWVEEHERPRQVRPADRHSRATYEHLRSENRELTTANRDLNRSIREPEEFCISARADDHEGRDTRPFPHPTPIPSPPSTSTATPTPSPSPPEEVPVVRTGIYGARPVIQTPPPQPQPSAAEIQVIPTSNM